MENSIFLCSTARRSNPGMTS